MASRFLGADRPRQDVDSGSLLSAMAYDDDAASLHSRSDQDSDSDDDALQQRARNSRELAAHDRILLLEDEETHKLVTESRAGRTQPTVVEPLFSKAAKLLTRRLSMNGGSLPDLTVLTTGKNRPSASPNSPQSPHSPPTTTTAEEKRRARRARRERKKDRLMAGAVNGEDGALMYELEEGGMREGSDTGESSNRDDDDDDNDDGGKQMLLMSAAPPKPKRDIWTLVLIYSVAVVGFALVVLGAWKLSLRSQGTASGRAVEMMSNGTSLFGPTTIIISLDGFRADFLQRNITPRLNAFIKEGVSPQYMLPSFPSVTFPNHYTLATGLYPESHGIVGNTFWDPSTKRDFYYTDPDRSLDPSWWSGEPFWVTAELQGVRTAVHMWPGSEAHILGVEPSFLDTFNGKEGLSKKVDRILELLDMPMSGSGNGTLDNDASSGDKKDNNVVNNTRPQLIAAYVPNVDGDGHKYGPNSTEINKTIRDADNMLDMLFQGLDQRNLSSIVNVIVVSDHGMATTDVTRLIQLEDLVDTDLVERIDGWPLYGLRMKNESDVERVYESLLDKTKENPNIEVYLRDVNMPERYHFAANDRIAPLWIVPKTGWALVTKEEFDVEDAKKKGDVYHPRGLHGYDHEHPLMRATFVARGPAFPHEPNSRIEHFQNVNVYNILCDSLGITPRPNNGTLRLPLKPIGLHSSDDQPAIPQDPVPPNTLSSSSSTPKTHQSSTKAAPMSTKMASTEKSGEKQTHAPVSVDPAPTAAPSAEPSKAPDEDKSIEEIVKGWWDWLTGKTEELWDSVTGTKGRKGA